MATTENPVSRATAIEVSGDCPECGAVVRADGGERVCDGCGLVVDEYWLDHGFEPRSFDEEDERERTGAPLTVARHDRGLSTEIGRGRDANGRPLSSRQRWQLGRLRTQHNRAKWRTKAERNLAHGLGEVKRLCAVLEVSKSVRDRGAVLFRAAQDEGLLQGRSVDDMAAASVYAACRELGVLRTAAEVGDASGTDEAVVRRDYTVLNRGLELAALPFPADLFVSGATGELGLSAAVRQRALAILTEADEIGLATGSPPSSLAAAAVYLAATEVGESVTQRAVAAACETTDTTIRSQVRRLESGGHPLA